MAEGAQALAGGNAQRPGDLKPTFETKGAQEGSIDELDRDLQIGADKTRFPLYSSFGNDFLTRQSEVESNARTSPRKVPLALKRGKGIYVEDTEGRTFIDCLAGAGALALGRSHLVVIEAIHSALGEEPPLQTLDLPIPLKDRFTAPGRLPVPAIY